MSDFDTEAPLPESSAPVKVVQRLLIVDDEKSVRDAVQLLMTAIGFDVISVDGGLAAIELFENPSASGEPIDWAIVDVAMPGIDGIETVQRIREIHPTLPIILATGYSDKSIPEELITHRNTALVQKPYRSEAILQVLETLQ